MKEDADKTFTTANQNLMKPNFFDRPYPIPKFKSKHHYKIWWEMDEIYHAIYLWPHNKKKFEE